jgi:hypothetical protein
VAGKLFGQLVAQPHEVGPGLFPGAERVATHAVDGDAANEKCVSVFCVIVI